MKITETDDKRPCEECDGYGYAFELKLKTDKYPTVTLCKNCLLKLLKAIIER